jgi:TonB-dependent receptor
LAILLSGTSIGVLLGVSDADAQQAGEVRGQVVAGPNAVPVAGAKVKVAKTKFEGTTGTDGSFAIPNIPAGIYEVSAETPDGNAAEAAVTVVPGQITTQRFVTAVEAERISVFGMRNPQSVARSLQKSAPNVVNYQSAEEIAKYPDVSSAEALSRVPGVSLETDTGEGRFVNIRGLDADLNGTTFGGVKLPASSPASPFGGGRAVAFDAIPAGFVGRIEVTKSLTPEQDAEGLGGQIEITPKTVRPGDAPFAEGTLGSGVEPLRGTPIVIGDLTMGGSFGLGSDASPWGQNADKPFSILATGTTYLDERGVDDVEAGYTDNQANGVPDKVMNNLDLRRYTYHRQRYGEGGEFAYRPNDVSNLYVRYAESGYTEDVNRQRLTYTNLDNANGDINPATGLPFPTFTINPANPNGFIAPDSTLATSLRDEVETLRNRVLAFGGSTEYRGFKIDGRGSFADGSYDKNHDYNSTFTSNPVAVAYNNTTDPNHPRVSVLTPGFDQTNPNNYTLTGLTNQSQHNRDGEWSGVTNVEAPLDLLDGEGAFKFGGSVRMRNRGIDQQNQNYTVVGGPTLASLDLGGTTHTYYDNNYNLPNQPNAKQIRILLQQSPGLFVQSVAADNASNLAAFERDREDIYAGYFQYSWNRGPAGILAGMRFEQTNANYASNQGIKGADGTTTFTPSSHSVNYFDFFPTVQGRYEFNPNLIGRLAYSTAIARPGFNQISGATQVDLGQGLVQSGNPNLQPTTVDNFDASIEWYLPNAGILSFGLFDKEFQNYIFARSHTGTFPGITGFATFTTFDNAGSAQAYGSEMNYHQKFDFLPEALNGLGVDLNYTYVSSSAEVRPGESEALPSTAQHTVNAALFYENHGVEARLSYDYVSQNLFAVGSSRATDIFSQPRGLLDLALQYQFTDNLKYFLNARNLLNTPLKFVQGGSDNRPTQREFYDVTIQSGLKFSF